MLTISNLTAHYGAAQALFGIDMAVAAGQTVALVGANGIVVLREGPGQAPVNQV